MRKFPKSLLKEFPEFKIFQKLNSPAKVQDFINTLLINFEDGRESCRSPLRALHYEKIHCMEGAMLAAAIFWYHGRPPLLLDLKTIEGDDDHVVALFKEGNRWGAVSKTNHPVLRYRDAVYKDVRELTMSYFNEYYLENGRKTLRSYSVPFDMLKFGDEWLTAKKNLWNITDALDASKHILILQKAAERQLRLVDRIEVKAGDPAEWKRRRN